MPFNRPDIATLLERIQTDLESRLPGADARLRRSVLYVIARMHAGAVHGMYGYLDWLAQQIMPDTAEAEHLARWASVWGVARTPASAAAGEVDFTGTSGGAIPEGTQLQTSDGTLYTTDAEVTLAAGVATAAVTAVDAGAAGNQDAGVSLTLISPIAGVQSQATVTAGGITGGADAEDDARLRERLLARIRKPAQGGAEHDYIAWSLEAHPDVTDVWVHPAELGLGTVTVRLTTYGAIADGIPEQTVVDAVQAYIDERRPVTANVTVVAPMAVPLDMTIQLRPNTSTVQQAVQAALADLLIREAAPGGVILVSRIREAISLAAGEEDHVLVNPAADVSHNTGEIATLGALVWQAL